MMIECLRVNKILRDNNISSEIINVSTLNPLEMDYIIKSVKKTKKILVVDNGWKNYGIGAEIIAMIYEKLGKNMKILCERIGISQSPIPSTISLAKFSYPNSKTIIKCIVKLLGKNVKINKKYESNTPLDQPDNNFLGPF